MKLVCYVITLKNSYKFICMSQELSGDEIQIDYRPVGSIPCDSVITTLLSWQGKLFVGHANRNIMVCSLLFTSF